MKKIRKFFLSDILKKLKLIICLTIAALGILTVLLLTGCWGEQNLFSDIGPAWSPDSSKIVYAFEAEKKSDIWIIKIDGSNKVNLTGSANNYYTPAWSPDGSKIAFVSQQNKNKIDIFVMNADGSSKVNLTGN
jgi:dipeptidyl aminopeptidase/acylaminoacyl peptidase